MGEWIASRKNRDKPVISTKYTSANNLNYRKNFEQNLDGTRIKLMEQSLKSLQVDSIDLFYSFNLLVVSGKVRQLGICDAADDRIIKANQYVCDKRTVPVCSISGHVECFLVRF